VRNANEPACIALRCDSQSDEIRYTNCTSKIFIAGSSSAFITVVGLFAYCLVSRDRSLQGLGYKVSHDIRYLPQPVSQQLSTFLSVHLQHIKTNLMPLKLRNSLTGQRGKVEKNESWLVFHVSESQHDANIMHFTCCF